MAETVTSTNDLRKRIAEALLDPLKCCTVTPFPLTPIHGTCKDCWTKALAAADAVLAALAGDPGDLPARMAAAIRAHRLDERSDDPPFLAVCVCGEQVNDWAFHRATAALSVRWERAAHLAARVGDAERRAEHAESEHQVTQERLAEARTQYANLRKAYDDTLALMAEADRTGGGE